MGEERIFELTVKKSAIARGGHTRIPKKVSEELGLELGASIVVSSAKKSRILQSYTDDLVEEGVIYLRKPDIDALGVKEGEKVRIKALRPVKEIAVEKVKATGQRMKTTGQRVQVGVSKVRKIQIRKKKKG